MPSRQDVFARIHELIIEGSNESLPATRARGRLGRPVAMTTEQIRRPRTVLTQPGEVR